MPSPFPGMDPYLENPAIWSDFLLTLIVAMRAELNAILPSGYIAAADRHVWRGDLHHKGKPYLKITDTQERRVITVIELLSPTNKNPGADRNAYLDKREEYFASGVNLIEINLLRGGKCPPLGKISTSEYYVLVCRAQELPRAAMWSFSIKQPFPDFVVPLRPGEQVVLNLRPCVDRAYQEAKYDREINYADPPFPPLENNDAIWARSYLKAKLS